MCAKSKEQFLVEELFEEFYQNIEESEMKGVTALSLSLDPATGDLTISEGTDSVSATKPIYAWMVSETLSAPEIEKNAVILMNRILRDLNNEGYFSRALFGRPLSVCYVDNNGGEANEMMVLEEEWVPDDRPLLEGMDEELDQFLNKLLEE